MLTSGYCSHCLKPLRLADRDSHAETRHPGQVIYVTLYRPDPAQAARNLAVADELMAAGPAGPTSTVGGPVESGS